MSEEIYLDVATEIRPKPGTDALPKHFEQNTIVTKVPLDNPADPRGYENVSLFKLITSFAAMKESGKAELSGMTLHSFSQLSTGHRAFTVHDIEGYAVLASVIMKCQHNKAFIELIEISLLNNILPYNLNKHIRTANKQRFKSNVNDINTTKIKSAISFPETYAFQTISNRIIELVTSLSSEGDPIFKSWVKRDGKSVKELIIGIDALKEEVSNGTKLRAKSKELGINESAYRIGSKIKKLDNSVIKHLVSIDYKGNVTILV